MKMFALAAGLLFFAQIMNAQVRGIEWTRTIGGPSSDEGYSVRQTTDGGYIVTGATLSYGAGLADIYMVKTNSSGDTLWTNTYGGSSNDWGECVNQCTDGGFIVAGVTSSYGAGGADVYLVKTDAEGGTEWTNTFGGASDDEGYSIQQTTDGGYIIAGSTQSFGAGSDDVYLIKTDSSGETLWTNTFGGIESDIGAFAQQTMDGGYIVCGSTESFGAGGEDVFLIRTDSSGDALWTRTVGGIEIDNAYYVQQTTDAGFILTGYTKSYGAGLKDVFLVKTDPDGNTLWTKTFGGSAVDVGESVQQTVDGGYILTGFTNSSGSGSYDVYLVKTDTSGIIEWTSTVGGPQYDRCNSIQQTMDGSYIVGGLTTSFGAGSSDVYLIKMGPESGVAGATGGSPVTLEPTYPNPFTRELNVTYSIREETRVDLAVFDISGRLVEELVSDQLTPGIHTAEWIPEEGTPGGCYLVRLDACGYCEMEKCLKLD